MERGSTVVPCMRYRDAKAAIDWLCRALGFERHLVVEGEKDTITHAELRHGRGMLMLGSARPGDPQAPEEGAESFVRTVYLVVADVDAHHDAAKAAGAEILLAPKDRDFGGRGYALRDLEGHVWHIGSYDPFAKAPGRIEYDEDDAKGVVEIRVAGRITAADFEAVRRRLEDFLARHERVRLVEVVESFEGMDLSLLFEDLLFSLRHLRRFSHVAVVTDLRWVERMANASAVILPARLRVFPLDALGEAREWVRRAP